MSSNTSYYRSPFGDTTFTKVFVGGLAWETPTEEMRRYFEQFGEILEAVIITDKITGKSKGYGFVSSSFFWFLLYLSTIIIVSQSMRRHHLGGLGHVSRARVSDEGSSRSKSCDRWKKGKL